jgi:hypothetical protein
MWKWPITRYENYETVLLKIQNYGALKKLTSISIGLKVSQSSNIHYAMIIYLDNGVN